MRPHLLWQHRQRKYFNDYFIEQWPLDDAHASLPTELHLPDDILCSELYFISYLSYYLHCCALPDKRCLSHSMLPLSGHNDVALFEWRRKWRWINTKIENYIIRVKQLVSWQIEYQVRLFWYQVYQARLWERLLNRLASLAMSTSVLKALPGKLDIKRQSPSILNVSSYAVESAIR